MSLSESQADELIVLQGDVDRARKAYNSYVEPYASGVAWLPPESEDYWGKVRELRRALHCANTELERFQILHAGC